MAEITNSEPMVQRLWEYLQTLGFNAYDLAEKLGYNSPEKIYRFFRKEGAKPSADFILGVSNKFDDFNLEWWLTGKGSMIKEKRESDNLIAEANVVYQRMPKVVVTNDKGNENIIMLDTKAAAGLPKHIDDEKWYAKLPTLKIPKITDKQGTFICVQLEGDSMQPTLYHDEWVVGKFIDDVSTLYGGDICLIVTNDGVVCKRVYVKDKKKGIIECVSDNDDYSPFELQPNEYLQLYKYACDINFSPRKRDSNMRQELNQISKRVGAIEKRLKLEA
jgi:phage repressor protein C with HTH and peptisase S24 domain